MQIYRFGDMPYGPFPFEEDGRFEKNRRVFVLRDTGAHVLVAYCTTNPALELTVPLGRCGEKAGQLAGWRWELVLKDRLHEEKGIVRPGRWSKEMLDHLALCAKANLYGEHSPYVLAELRHQRDVLLATQRK